MVGGSYFVRPLHGGVLAVQHAGELVDVNVNTYIVGIKPYKDSELFAPVMCVNSEETAKTIAANLGDNGTYKAVPVLIAKNVSPFSMPPFVAGNDFEDGDADGR